MPGRKRLSSSVLKALAYSDIFDYPLTIEEILKFLAVEAERGELKKALASLKKRKLVSKKHNLWSLGDREQIINLRKERQKLSRKKLALARKAAKILCLIPSVQFVGISGSLASLNAKEADDIDLFIITKARTVWSTRLASTILLDILGKRRKKGDREFKDKVCLNMFISEDALEFHEGDLYLAREIAQLYPFYDRGGSYKSLIQENSWWLGTFLPNFKPIPSAKRTNGQAPSLLAFFEPFARNLQLLYMNGHTQKEVLEKNRLFFHPRNVRGKILDQYDRRIARLSS